MKYKYKGYISKEDIERCKVDTFTLFGGEVATLSKDVKKYFYNLVNRIKEILDCDTEIINGDLELIEQENAPLGTNINKGELIIIDNFYIYETTELGSSCLERGLIETICHEIAHNKYEYHGRWHTALTEEYISKVNSALEAVNFPRYNPHKRKQYLERD